ncbi:MAG TPA: ATP-binding protein [Casimicrobiaceae bacterium]|jgi:anti-sigma regulatory factor (Ser/Thr protein kinase)|nr:ATP-binding protein [Casimicrobiaceae bacterium]
MTRAARTFDAALECVVETAAFVAGFCEAHGIESRDALRVTLIVEELFLNIVMHGYAGEPGGTIHLALAVEARDVLVVCEDRAREYDPRPALERVPEDLDDPVETRRVGGLGQYLVGRLVREAHYERAGDANRLTLRIGRSGQM